MNRAKLISKAACLAAAAVLSVFSIPLSVGASQVTGYAENSTPIAENLSVSTYRQVAVTSPLYAVDPDGDIVCFEVSRGARKGTVEISGSSFTYTPDDDARGEDSFSYTATDRFGAVSREANVCIDIKARTSGIKYDDMDGHRAAYAAQRLAESDIFIGRKVGSSCFFGPDEPVSRDEFLAMCMETAGKSGLSGVIRTGFDDDVDISVWAKPYVSAAMLAGIVRGYPTDDGSTVFMPKRNITFSEAQVLLSRVLSLTPAVGAVSLTGTAEEWAASAAADLAACRIISPASAALGEREITRADAAEMLSAAMDILEARQEQSESTSLLERIFG